MTALSPDTPVDFRQLLANAKQMSKDGGSTLDLSDQSIRELPLEMLDIMKDEVARYGASRICVIVLTVQTCAWSQLAVHTTHGSHQSS